MFGAIVLRYVTLPMFLVALVHKCRSMHMDDCPTSVYWVVVLQFQWTPIMWFVRGWVVDVGCQATYCWFTVVTNLWPPSIVNTYHDHVEVVNLKSWWQSNKNSIWIKKKNVYWRQPKVKWPMNSYVIRVPRVNGKESVWIAIAAIFGASRWVAALEMVCHEVYLATTICSMVFYIFSWLGFFGWNCKIKISDYEIYEILSL